ncbi:MAG: ABC transporter permease [Patescibacteria group bacterium]|jgi:putative ABC transport system permease protein|nr:ABC transporter permease [Patescibacteria group bacterium]
MIEIFRNMWRRKFRTFLTIFGIVIGIFAFTVMGSMALKLNKMIDGGKKYVTGQISISPKGASSFGGAATGTLPIDTMNKISEIEGVDHVAAMASLLVSDPDPDNAEMNFGNPPTIYGADNQSDFKNHNWETMNMREGKMLDKNSKDDEVTVGINIATDKKLHVGDIFNIRGRDFKVVGITEKTMTGPDDYVFMNITPAREMLIASNPFMKSLYDSGKLKLEDVNSMAGVSWKDGADSEKVAAEIKDKFGKDVTVMSPVKMGEMIDKASATFNAIILGSAMLALIVGLFSIVNTMVMSISERTKEIGIKKAIGASPRSIAFEYTMEAGVIGLAGGAIGMGLGVLAATIVNNKMAEKGAEIFLIEPSFLVAVIVFSFVIGVVAGIIPAVRAAKLKVVESIREL